MTKTNPTAILHTMTDLEARLRTVEDRLALQDALTRYCTAIDSLENVDALLDCFAEDGTLDLTGIDLPRFEGHEQIRGFFEQVFADMSHHAHFNTNFVVENLESDTAHCRAYVMGMGKTHDDREVLVYVKYYLDYIRIGDQWKIKYFGEASLMPLPESVTNIHGR